MVHRIGDVVESRAWKAVLVLVAFLSAIWIGWATVYVIPWDKSPRGLAIGGALLLLVPLLAAAYGLRERGLLLLGIVLLSFDGSIVRIPDVIGVYGHDLLFIAILVLYWLNLWGKRYSQLSKPINEWQGVFMWLGLFLIWVTFRWMQNRDGVANLGEVTRLWVALGYFYLWSKQKISDAKPLLFAIMLTTGIISISGNLAHVISGEELAVARLSEGFLDNPNTFSQYLLLFGPTVLLLAFTSRYPALRLTAIVVSISYLGSLLFAQSRGAWFAMLVQLGLLVLLGRGTNRFKYVLWIVFIAVVALLVVGTVLPVDPFVIVSSRLFASEEGFGILGYRPSVWGASLRLIAENPLTGISVAVPFGLKLLEAGGLTVLMPGIRAHGHNLFLTLIAVHGIVGFLLIMYPLLQVLRRAIYLGAAIVRKKRNGAQGLNLIELLFLGLGLGLVGELVYGFFEYTFFVRQVETAFWIVCGILASLSVELETRLRESPLETL